MKSVIIGISGPAGSGKSTVADLICKNYFASRVSFADPIREMLHPLIDQLMYKEDDSVVQAALRENKEEILKDINMSPRFMMQRLGGFFRDLNPNTFVTLADKKIEMLETINKLLSSLAGEQDDVPTYGYIIDDVRYDNEALWVRDIKQGGIVRVERPQELLKEVPDHHSERGISIDFLDFTYTNSDKMEDAERIADELATHYKLTPMPQELPTEGKIVMPMENTNVH